MSLSPDLAKARLFCFGLGYSARRVVGQVGSVAGTYRSAKPIGVAAFPFSRDRPLAKDGLAALVRATHLLISIPPDRDGDGVLAIHAAALRAAADLRWIGYLSTTGVYGDTGGAWVDETAPLKPTSDRSRWRVEAEAAWLAFGRDTGKAVQVFRLAGIYGPGRSVFDRIAAGEARRIDKPDHLFSRIHVDDIARALIRSMAAPRPGAVWNVCDDEPATQADVIAHACRLLGREPPPLVPFAEAAPKMSPMALSFWRDNRRVDNRKIKRELGGEFIHPNYRAGLKAILGGESS